MERNRKRKNGVTTVSYTHLDVYKRQPPVSSESKPLVKWTGNVVDLVEMVYGICVMGSVNDGDAVSYTHLDVYKRQVYIPYACSSYWLSWFAYGSRIKRGSH